MRDPHLWPESTAATLLAALDATRKADEAARFARAIAQDGAE